MLSPGISPLIGGAQVDTNYLGHNELPFAAPRDLLGDGNDAIVMFTVRRCKIHVITNFVANQSVP
jgi:hypothetical protein